MNWVNSRNDDGTINIVVVIIIINGLSYHYQSQYRYSPWPPWQAI